jgi:RNA polymerase sigma factor (sigma-70 family)
VTSDRDGRIADALRRLTDDVQDQDAWAELYLSLRPYVFSIAHRHLGSVAAAEDVTQDVFVRLATARPFGRLHDTGQLRAYVAAMTRNIAISQFRSARRQPPDSHDLSEPTEAFEMPSFDTLLALEELTQALTPADRRLLELVLEGRRLPEMAEQLGISYSAAGVRLHRLRQRIAAHLGRNHPG